VQLLRPTHPYVATWQGFVYVAFIIDVFARRIVGWRVSRTAQSLLLNGRALSFVAVQQGG
jgi:transposase InsO family protein